MLKIFALGGVRLLVEDENVTNELPRKGIALIVYLAYTQREHSRDYLATLLWNTVRDKAGASLRAALSALRDPLGDYFYADRQVVGLSDAVWLDVHQFLDSASLAEAVDYYQGDFLHGFSVRNASNFEEWMFQEQRWLRARSLETLHILMEQALDQQQYEQGVVWAQRALSLDAYDEMALQHLMLCHMRSGQRQQALQTYEAFSQRYEDEFETSVSDEILQLAQQIRYSNGGHHQEASPEITVQIPYIENAFIGRDVELEVLAGFLENPHENRLITITGPGGVGKSRLATTAARQHTTTFPDGIYFVPLASVETEEDLLANIVNVLKIPVFENIKTALLHYLQDKCLLLILDNYEHLLPAVNIVLEILTVARTISIIVTSRVPLNLQEETVLNLTELPTYSEAGGHAPAIQLFMERARRLEHSFQYTEEVDAICELVDGLPLAIELAASWVSLFSPSQIRDNIQDNLDFLSANWRDLPPRHRSMRAVFDQTWDFLSAEEQQILARLSLFRSSFTIAAAQAVARANPYQLAMLARKSLISGQDRYQLHTVTRQYSAEKLEMMPIARSTRKAYVRYYLKFAETHGLVLYGEEQGNALAKLNDEKENMRAALDLCDEVWVTDDMRLRFIQALHSYWAWQMRTGQAEAFNIARQLVDRIETFPANEMASEALWGLSALEWSSGFVERGLDLLKRGLDIAIEIGHLRLQTKHHLGLGSTYLSLGDGEKTTYHFQAGIDAFRQTVGDRYIAQRASVFQKIVDQHPYVETVFVPYDARLTNYPLPDDTYVLMDHPENRWMLSFLPILLIHASGSGRQKLAYPFIPFREGLLTVLIYSYRMGHIALANADPHLSLSLFANALLLGEASDHHPSVFYALLSLAKAFLQMNDPETAACYLKVTMDYGECHDLANDETQWLIPHAQITQLITHHQPELASFDAIIDDLRLRIRQHSA